MFCLRFLENFYYYKQVARENYFSYEIDERAKIIRILGLILIEKWGRTGEPT